MIVIRRLVDRHRAYTGIFLPGEPAQIFPTTDYEHGRILQIYKQDKAHAGIVNDFSDDHATAPAERSSPVAPPPAPKPVKKTSAHAGQQKKPRTQHRDTR